MSNELIETPKPLVDPSWCGKCQKLVMKVGKGRCPICGGFTTGHTERLRERADDARRAVILDGLVREFGQPQTETERSVLHTLARVMAALEKSTPGKQEHKNLVADQTALASALTELRKSRPEQQSKELEKLTDEELLEQLIELEWRKADRYGELKQKWQQERHALLADNYEAELKELRERKSTNQPAPQHGFLDQPSGEPREIPPEIAGSAADCNNVGNDSVRNEENTSIPKLAAPPIEHCPYCRKSLADCADLRASRVETWEVLHYKSPEMVERRRDYDARVMFESLRRQGR